MYIISGLYLENYISEHLRNVTLTVLDGEVFYEIEDEENGQSLGIKLETNTSIPVDVGIFHRIHTISTTPSRYMYTYINGTKEALGIQVQDDNERKNLMKAPFPLLEDMEERLDNFLMMLGHISNAFLNLVYDVPIVRRTRLYLAE